MVVEEEGGLYQQLHKLSAAIKSTTTTTTTSEIEEEEEEEALIIVIEDIILRLWKSRKTGLPSADKSHLQSLLHLPSLSHLDPVLACLRSLMRKFVHENMNGDDLLKLFPPDLPIHLQSILILLFQKHLPQWKLDISSSSSSSISIDLQQQHQHPSLRPSLGVPPPPTTPFKSLSSSDISQPPLWRCCQNDPINNCCFIGGGNGNGYGYGYGNGNGNGNVVGPSSASSVVIAADSNMSLRPPECHDQVQGMLPRLKSMTWSMEKGKSVPTNKVAVINLKLQDYTSSTSGEMEVKFRLTRETLEAMLRSMTYISEQLSSIVGSSSGPMQKKQRQSDHIV